MNEFLYEVGEWLKEYRNKSVRDGLSLSKKIMTEKAFKSDVRQFLSARFLQMFGETIPKDFLTRATTKFIKEWGF